VTNFNDADDEKGLEAWNLDDEDNEFVDTEYDGDEYYDDEADDESDEQDYKEPIRGVSEDIAAAMEMD